ncbi:pentatricopeptide repeat-containing protein, partial [Tanacetum coccineum]
FNVKKVRPWNKAYSLRAWKLDVLVGKGAFQVGNLFVDIKQLKECLTFYALANGFSLWFYKSSKAKLIEKGLKDGWNLGCRKIIALDGCFLKRPSVGEILTAIGRDANNHIFLVAWAVVNVENKDKWSWCLDLLGDELEMPTSNGLTLMSDQHKGLIEAVKELMPHAEHRQCARHIYEGFRKHYSGDVFRQLFWVDSKATYPGMLNKIMEKIKRANPKAYDYVVKKEPKTWSMAYFHIGTNCEAIENGFSECFNSVILSVRSKPRITMLEAMRAIVFGKNAYYEEFVFWHVIPTGGHLFVVKNGSEAFDVDKHHRNCTCRLWQLSSLPCCHAIAVIFKLNRMPDCSDMLSVLPPKPRIMLGRPRTMPGRPRKKRIKAAHENKNPKQGRSRKILEVGSSLIDEDIDTPVAKEQFVQEQASDFDVGGSTEKDVRGYIKNDVGGSSEFDVGGSSDVKGCNQFGLRRGENDIESNPVKDSEVAQETNQNVDNDSFATTQDTLNFSDTAFASTQNTKKT